MDFSSFLYVWQPSARTLYKSSKSSFIKKIFLIYTYITDYPFIPLVTNPWIMYFWAKININTTGIMAIREAAIWGP